MVGKRNRQKILNKLYCKMDRNINSVINVFNKKNHRFHDYMIWKDTLGRGGLNNDEKRIKERARAAINRKNRESCKNHPFN